MRLLSLCNYLMFFFPSLKLHYIHTNSVRWLTFLSCDAVEVGSCQPCDAGWMREISARNKFSIHYSVCFGETRSECEREVDVCKMWAVKFIIVCRIYRQNLSAQAQLNCSVTCQMQCYRTRRTSTHWRAPGNSSTSDLAEGKSNFFSLQLNLSTLFDDIQRQNR